MVIGSRLIALPECPQFVSADGEVLSGDPAEAHRCLVRKPHLKGIAAKRRLGFVDRGVGLARRRPFQQPAIHREARAGTRAAWRHGSRFDQLSTGTALMLWSVPTFWLGLIVLMVFSVGLDLFPTAGMTSPGGVSGWLPAALDLAHHLVLPALTMTAVVYAQYLMVMRSSLLEEMNADYLTTARAKGLRDDLVRRRHAVPNALLPTVTIIFLHIGLLVSGAVTVEKVFSWPGLGLLTYEAIQIPDYPLLQGTLIVLAGAVIVMNVLADIVYRLVDPRVRAT